MTQLNIASVNEGGAGKKYGTLKTTEGAVYMLPVGLNGVFQAGTTVDVPVKQETWKDKQTGQQQLKHIINGRPGAAGSGVVAQPTPQPSPPPAQSARMTNTQPDKDVLITATALMKSFIETGNFGLTDLETLMKACVPAARLMVRAACGVPNGDH
jgi:hypothetical protein